MSQVADHQRCRFTVIPLSHQSPLTQLSTDISVIKVCGFGILEIHINFYSQL